MIETTGWRIHTTRRRSRGGACLRACWGADGLEAITGALSAFSGFCSNSTERGAAYGLSYVERVPFPRPFVPRVCPLPQEAIPNSPHALAHPVCVRPVALPPTGHSPPRAESEGRANFCARWRVRGAPPISPRAALPAVMLRSMRTTRPNPPPAPLRCSPKKPRPPASPLLAPPRQAATPDQFQTARPILNTRAKNFP